MVVLYTTGCPRCKVLEAKLAAKQIDYQSITDVETMLKKGLNLMPVLEVDGELFDFASAVDWVNHK